MSRIADYWFENRAGGRDGLCRPATFLARGGSSAGTARADSAGNPSHVHGDGCKLARGEERGPSPYPGARPAMGWSHDGQPKENTGSAIWVVEENTSRTLYSNGLSVRREHEAESVPRRYRAYRRETLAPSDEGHVPVGIVFHTTESLILPLEAGLNPGLLRSGRDVLEHAQRGRLYNFLIDRFGQVSRVVPEGQTALHAGHSVWASGDSVWVDLNESFLGVSFEAQSSGPFAPSEAQVHSGRLLTEVLRSRFGIGEANCVTHAQVSVNPENLRIGYHTDWGSAFPFQAMGLPDNYRLPVAAVSVFGFGHDDTFSHAIHEHPWTGLLAADEEIAARAARAGVTANEFSKQLQKLYGKLRRQRNG